MKRLRIEEMVKGWFVGDFEPTVLRTSFAEVAVKRHAAGEYEQAHFHKIATEVTVIVDGEVEMNGERYVSGDIIVMEPGETTDFRALTESVNVIVKLPSAKNDKYPAEDSSRA